MVGTLKLILVFDQIYNWYFCRFLKLHFNLQFFLNLRSKTNLLEVDEHHYVLKYLRLSKLILRFGSSHLFSSVLELG
jgi:hypothetical protein